MTAREDGLERYPTLEPVAGLNGNSVYHIQEVMRSGEPPSERWGSAYTVRENDDLQWLRERRQAPIPDRQQLGMSMDEPNEVRRRRERGTC